MAPSFQIFRDGCYSDWKTAASNELATLIAPALKEHQQEMLDAGMDDFVRKLYRFDEIYECMPRHLGIKYLYDSMPATEERTSQILTAKMLTVLPVEQLQQLREDLISLDRERIALTIRQIC